MKISIGCDHRCLNLKNRLITWLKENGHDVVDVGTFSEDSVDYPDFAYKVAEAVATGECKRGIMIDGAGVGSAIVANKVPGIRAVCGNDYFMVKNSRVHNNTNVLTLGSEVSGFGKTADLVKLWLYTEYEGGRHQRRIDKITEIEKRFSLDLSGISKIIKDILSKMGFLNKSIKENRASDTSNLPFITVEELKNENISTEYIVPSGRRLTPLASDYLKDKGIGIK